MTRAGTVLRLVAPHIEAAGVVSFAALAVALGCDPARIGEAFDVMKHEALPVTSQQAVDVMRSKLRDAGLIP